MLTHDSRPVGLELLCFLLPLALLAMPSLLAVMPWNAMGLWCLKERAKHTVEIRLLNIIAIRVHGYGSLYHLSFILDIIILLIKILKQQDHYLLFVRQSMKLNVLIALTTFIVGGIRNGLKKHDRVPRIWGFNFVLFCSRTVLYTLL